MTLRSKSLLKPSSPSLLQNPSSIPLTALSPPSSPTYHLFDHYCRKQSLLPPSSTFDSIQSSLHLLQLTKFSLLLKHLALPLSRHQTISMFQSHSVSQVMSYELFEEAVEEMEGRGWGVRGKAEEWWKKERGREGGEGKDNEKGPGYRFKVMGHSGKGEQEILEELEERKKKRMSLKLEGEVKREKERQVKERKMGVSKRPKQDVELRNRSGSKNSIPTTSRNPLLSREISPSNPSFLKPRFQSLNASPRLSKPSPSPPPPPPPPSNLPLPPHHPSPPQDLYLQSFLQDSSDDEYLDSLYKPSKLKEKVSKRKLVMAGNTRSVVEQIEEMEIEKEARGFGTIERAEERREKVVRKYKMEY